MQLQKSTKQSSILLVFLAPNRLYKGKTWKKDFIQQLILNSGYNWKYRQVNYFLLKTQKGEQLFVVPNRSPIYAATRVFVCRTSSISFTQPLEIDANHFNVLFQQHSISVLLLTHGILTAYLQNPPTDRLVLFFQTKGKNNCACFLL